VPYEYPKAKSMDLDVKGVLRLKVVCQDAQRGPRDGLERSAFVGRYLVLPKEGVVEFLVPNLIGLARVRWGLVRAACRPSSAPQGRRVSDGEGSFYEQRRITTGTDYVGHGMPRQVRR
jgi:hypothetical protein